MTVMLASKFNEKRAQKLLDKHYGLIVQEKFDGARVYVKGSKLYTRTDKEIILPECPLKEAIDNWDDDNLNIDDWVLDGELLVCDRDLKTTLPRQVGNGLINKAIHGNLSSEEANFKLMVFDTFSDDYEYMEYTDRLDVLDYLEFKSGAISIVDSYYVNALDTVYDLYRDFVSEGSEGIMVKSPANLYVPKRVLDIMKMKEELTVDLRVVGHDGGTGKYEGMLGSLLCMSEDEKIMVSVGTGLTDEQRKNPPQIGQIVEVKYNSLIQDDKGNYSLFLPVFKGIREDKQQANLLKDLL